MKIKVSGVKENGDIDFDVSLKSLESSGIKLGDAISLEIPGGRIEKIPLHSGPYCKMFATVLIVNDRSARLTVRGGNASREYHLKKNQEVNLELAGRKLFWEKENAYSFKEIRDKTLYENIESFANFRPLFSGGKMFFRSSSPVDDAYGRASAVIDCITKYKIATIINVADSYSEFLDLMSTTDKRTRDILLKRCIVATGDDSGLFSEKFERSLVFALKSIIELRGPFLIHCRAGKRRSGFVCAVLQGLAGMSATEIEADYMISYKNNNGVVFSDNPSRYEYLRNDTIRKMLRHINGERYDNLIHSTEDYLQKIGMDVTEIIALEEKLINDKGPH